MPKSDDDVGRGSVKPGELDAESSPHLAKASERFVFQKLLGKGASGAVYQAYDRSVGATVAVKFLTELDPGSVFRFKSEFRMLANIVDQNLLQLYELLSYGDDWLLTMEFVEGTDFLSFVRPPTTPSSQPAIADEHDDDVDTGDMLEADSAPTAAMTLDTKETMHSTAVMSSAPHSDIDPMATLVPPRSVSPTSETDVWPYDESRLRAAFMQLCHGLSALHRANRLHRDLKPANVLVASADARVVICDFGLALEGPQLLDSTPPQDAAVHERTAGRRELVGTLPFMSPEQARADILTAASDWYAVGVMLYQALTGRLPFAPSLSYNSALRAKARGRAVHPAVLCPGVPGDLADLAIGMLHPNPQRRAGLSDAMHTLEKQTMRAARRVRMSRAFVGREDEQAQLESAFSTSRSGMATLALISGASGMGKSELVQHFLKHVERNENALVLRSRCYEREELPYKAIDPLVDALSSHFMTLDDQDVRALLPPKIACLASLFPALKRVRAISELPDSAAEIHDPRERKRLAFRSFRELCKELCANRPLVLFIDDLQWGDRDSAPLFQELFMAPNAPPVLVVCAYRSESESHSPLLGVLRALHQLNESMLRLVEVRVSALSTAASTQLASRMLADHSTSSGAAALIAREAEGSPFFVRELAAYVNERGIEATSRIQIGSLIKTQLDALTQDGRDVLSMIAVAGRPIATATIHSASQLGSRTLKAFRELEARRLVSSTRTEAELRVECYHDRIREAAYASLTSDQARVLHRALAQVLENEAQDDCDALLEHWRAAGEPEKARYYAERGARKAEAALAFTRAADLYREALSLLPSHDPEHRKLKEQMGHALMLAGRGLDAAAVFQQLIVGATPAETLKYRMLATTQLLRGGKISAGLDELARADDLFGVSLPRSDAKALLMLATRQARLAFKEKHIVINAMDRHPEQRDRLAALWEVAAAVSSADLLRGQIYGAELMLRAIKLGDPSHVAGACGLGAVSAAAANDNARSQRLIALADQAAQATGSQGLIGRVRGMHAVCCQLLGSWRASVRLARESQELQRRAAEITWDSAIIGWWEITSAAFAGYIGDLVTQVPQALSEAEARGDKFAATSFRTHRCCWAWLAIDHPAVADHHVDNAERDWTPNGYQFQHWHMAYSRSDIDLYRGTPKSSLERVNAVWGRARLLRQVYGVKVDMHYTRGRLALAVARAAPQPSLIKLAIADARALQARKTSWSSGLGLLVLAGAASFESSREALRQLSAAERLFAATDMALHVEAARVRRGELIGGSEGLALQDSALERIRMLGVKRPDLFVDMVAPFNAGQLNVPV